MEVEDVILPACLIIIAAAKTIVEKRNRKKRVWVRPWIQRREKFGAYNSLMRELSLEDPCGFKNFLRMTKEDFDYLLEMVSPLIQRKDTVLRSSISAAERLSLTLRFLASGDSFKSLEYLYRVPVCTLSAIIPETCYAIHRALQEKFLQVPKSDEDWLDIAKEFYLKWNFPNCIGAMDGKHIAIKCPKQSGSMYFNYKNFFSIVLFAVVDANYKFIYVDVGCNGRISDGGVFANSALNNALTNNCMKIPSDRELPGRMKKMSYVIVGDEAFPLKKNLMKPYPQRQLDVSKRIFNYRLSRARQIVENVFGILSNRFGIFKSTITLEPEKAEYLVLACCALHNFLRSRESATMYSPPGTFDEENEDGSLNLGNWRKNASSLFETIPEQCANRSTNDAREIRDEFCDFFNTNGQVPWQWELI